MATAPSTLVLDDQVQGFTLPSRDARGRVVRIGATATAILSAHAYPPRLKTLLGEALALTALLGSVLRVGEGQLTMQAQSRGGPVDLLVCDYRAGELRGYLRFDAERLNRLGARPSLKALFGQGYLAITLDQTVASERYQGIVPLEGATFAEAAQTYFAQSEQLPTLVKLAAVDRGDAGWSVGGLLVQHFPQGELGGARLDVASEDRGSLARPTALDLRHVTLDEAVEHPDWRHVAALAGTVGAEELTDAGLPLTDLLFRLFHEDGVRATPSVPLSRGCRCSVAHIQDVLSRLPPDDRAHMVGDDGRVGVDCAFCSRHFAIAL